jgi:mannosyl-3-phosphoglycerate synthase
MQASLLAINNSKICNLELTKEIKNHLLMLQIKQNYNSPKIKLQKRHRIMDPIKIVPIEDFADMVIKNSKTFLKI